MSQINITESKENHANLYYIQSLLGELLTNAKCKVMEISEDKRVILKIECPDHYADIIRAEIIDKIAEIIVIKYKYEFFKRTLTIGGLNASEKEILITSLISADFDDDKKYSAEKLKKVNEIAIDGVYNFRLVPLKKKWEEVVSYMPGTFISNQLKDFIGFLLENKKKRVYIDGGKVYDCHFRRLKRASLLDGEELKLTKEILLSNCGEIEITGEIPKDDERYIREYYGDKIFFSNGYSS